MKIKLLKDKYFECSTSPNGSLGITFHEGEILDNVELTKGRWLASHPQNKNIYFDLEDAADFEVIREEKVKENSGYGIRFVGGSMERY